MAGWLDPPHERVTLSPDELRAVGQLERAFSEPGPGAIELPPVGLRCRVLARSMRWARLTTLLLPVGVVVFAVALPVSLPVSAAGACLMAVGLAACLWRARVWAARRRAQRLPGR